MPNYCLCGPAAYALKKLGRQVSGQEPDAITFMGVTFFLVKNPSAELKCHESIHRKQELRFIPWWGKRWPLKGLGKKYSRAVYYRKYLNYFREVGYEDNPLEIEAFNAEKRFAQTGKCE